MPVSHSHSPETSSAEGIDGAAIAISLSFVGGAALIGLHAPIVHAWAHPGRVQVPLPSHFPHNHVACTWPRITSPSDTGSTRRLSSFGYLVVALVGGSSSNRRTFLTGESAWETSDLGLFKADFRKLFEAGGRSRFASEHASQSHAPDPVLLHPACSCHALAAAAAAFILASSALYCSRFRCGYLQGLPSFSKGQVPSFKNLLQWKGTKRLVGVRAGDLPLPPPFPPPFEAEAERGLSLASKSSRLMNKLCENGQSFPLEQPFPTPYRAAEWK